MLLSVWAEMTVSKTVTCTADETANDDACFAAQQMEASWNFPAAAS